MDAFQRAEIVVFLVPTTRDAPARHRYRALRPYAQMDACQICGKYAVYLALKDTFPADQSFMGPLGKKLCEDVHIFPVTNTMPI